MLSRIRWVTNARVHLSLSGATPYDAGLEGNPSDRPALAGPIHQKQLKACLVHRLVMSGDKTSPA
jgi:hypothetical protein